MMALKRILFFLWFLAVCSYLFWIATGEAYDIPRLANRSEIRSLQALDRRPNMQFLAVDRNVLRALALNRLNRVILPVLEDDVIFHKISQKMRKKNATWIGKDESGKIRILITLGDDHFFGKVVSDDKTILFEPVGSESQAVSYLLDRTLEVPLIDDEVIPTMESRAYSSTIQSADDGSRIDVMVLYTNGMANAHPGSQIETRIQYLIDQGNYALSNSDINTQFNLVHSDLINYPDDSLDDMNEAINDLTNNIGVFINVEALRTEYGADQVTLLRRFVDEGCGMAWLLQNDNADYAYAVVHDGSKSDGSGYYCSDLTYVHEIGHNFGCAHDRANASGSGRYPYSYGYQNPDEKFRTVMSYDCPGGCPQIEYFSSPNISYYGDPTGIGYPDPNSADNASTIKQTRVGMAKYRAEITPSITVISPNGGEIWKRGTTRSITWTSFNLSGNVVIELFQDGVLSRTINRDARDTGSYSWTVPLSQPLGSNYRIRISSVASPSIFDENDNDFTIAEALKTKAMPWIPLLLFK